MTVRQDLFSYTINQLRHGLTQEELSEELNRCVQAAQDTGKSARLTLELTIKPTGGGQYLLTDKISTKLPTLDREATLMFGTPEGNLTRDDPRQSKLPLRQVEDDTTHQELRKV